jgi:hypothetical protein
MIRTKRVKKTKPGDRSSWTGAEIHRFHTWLEERRTSTAPVSTWPLDELDFFGGRAPHPKVRKPKKS